MSKRRRTPTLAKVFFELEPDSWHGHTSESVWAESLGEGRYRIRNVPFFAKGIAVEDVVLARMSATGPVFTRVLIHSGHSTYRIFLTDDIGISDPRYLDAWGALERHGCTVERASEHLLAVDVPSHAMLPEVYELLQLGEEHGVWEFEEGHAAL